MHIAAALRDVVAMSPLFRHVWNIRGKGLCDPVSHLPAVSDVLAAGTGISQTAA